MPNKYSLNDLNAIKSHIIGLLPTHSQLLAKCRNILIQAVKNFSGRGLLGVTILDNRAIYPLYCWIE